MRTQIASVDKVTVALLQRSFFDFVQEFWPVVNPGRDPVWNWHIEYICNALQKNAERVFANLPKEHDTLINVPPGTTKSTICSQMFPAWIWTRMPHAVIIAASYSETLALEHSRKTKQIIESPRFQHLFPHIKISKAEDTAAKYTLTTGGRRASYGTGTGVTGTHADFIVVDDPISAQDANSDAERNAANIWFKETLSTRVKDKAVAHTTVVMQRLHEADVAGEMLSEAKDSEGNVKGLEWICLPGEDDGVGGENGDDCIHPPEVRKFYVEGLLDPIRLSRSILDGLLKKMGEFAYAGQIQQRPAPREGSLFKTVRLTYESRPRLEDLVGIVRHWDKAGTKGAGAYSVGVLMGQNRITKKFIVIDVLRAQWSTDEREINIRAAADIDASEYPNCPVSLEQEGGSGGKESVEGTVKNLAGHMVVSERPTGDKYTRALPFSVQVNFGNVGIAVMGNGKPPPWARAYVAELNTFPGGRYKDQVDASSGAFAYLNRPRRRAGGLFSQ